MRDSHDSDDHHKTSRNRYTVPSSARSSTLLQGFRLLLCAPYAKIAGDATQRLHYYSNQHDMFLFPFTGFPSLPVSCSLLLYLLSTSASSTPQDKHREIHSRDGGQRLDLSAYVQGSQVQWRGVEVLQVQHATL